MIETNSIRRFIMEEKNENVGAKDGDLGSKGLGSKEEGKKEEGSEGEGSKTYSHEEVQSLLQKETDRRVSSALRKQEDKFKNSQRESEKLRNMDSNQRKEYELNQRIEELEGKEREYAIMSNKIECSKILIERGLDASFVDYVISDSADDMLVNIDTFDKAFKAAVAEQVSKKIGGKTPSNGGTSQKNLDVAAFKKLSIAEQSEIYRTNPTLYKQLSV